MCVSVPNTEIIFVMFNLFARHYSLFDYTSDSESNSDHIITDMDSNIIDWLNGPDVNVDNITLSSSVAQNVSSSPIDANKSCMFWPSSEIENNWEPRQYLLKLGEPDTIRQCLSYWSHESGIDQWVHDPQWMFKKIPSQHETSVASELDTDFANLHESDLTLLCKIYTDIVMQDESFISLIPYTVHEKWMNMCVIYDGFDIEHFNEHRQRLKQYYDIQWNIENSTHDYTKKGPSNIAPSSNPDFKWYPGPCRFWMDEYYRWMMGIIDQGHVLKTINRVQLSEITVPDHNEENLWVPLNQWHLYRMYRSASIVNAVSLIKCYPPPHDINTSNKERVFAYDSFVSDLTMYLQNPLHREALLGTKKQHMQYLNKNPMNRGTQCTHPYHSCDWRLSKFGLFKFLEKVVFVVNSANNGQHLWETKMITVGTFIDIGNKNDFALVTNVISTKWTFEMDRDVDNQETFLEWNIRLLKYIDNVANNLDNIDNKYLYPKYHLKILPLFWKFQYCQQLHKHEHADRSHADYRQVWLNVTNMTKYASNLITTITVTDNIGIHSLAVSNMLLFPDPNKYGQNELVNENSIWHWNVIVDNQHAMSPLMNKDLILLFRCLKDPFDKIWAGKQNLHDINTKMIVLPIQMNTDAFEYIQNSTSKSGQQSTKENFICPVDHALSNNLLTSFGVVISGMNNMPFYEMFAKDILHSMFVGHEVEIWPQHTINVFIYLCGMLNDGDETRNVTGLVGGSGSRPDYFTVFNKHSPISTFLKQPYRHHKIMITQSVKSSYMST